MQKINLKKLHEDAILPKYQTTGAIAFDLHTIEDVKWIQCSLSDLTTDTDIISFSHNIFPDNIPVFTATIRTGLAIELPESTGMFVYPRSGWGFKHNISLANGTGLIDSDYRGEVQVKLIAIAPNNLPKIEKGARVAQATIMKVEKPELCFVEELNETKRGTDGFGSTGH